MIVVIDASVAVKWFFNDSEQEPDVERALAILDGIRGGQVEPLQPPHWLVEMAAVFARLEPDSAAGRIELLDAMEFPVNGEMAVYRRAAQIASELNHHLFDTLYHALALENNADLVSADRRYCRKAGRYGRITYLADWPLD